MLTILHGADFHLDSPFSGLTPTQAAQRRQEQRALLSRLADLAREEQADLVLLSGDLLDSQQVYRETAQALSTTLGQLPCPVLIAPGNHDCMTSGSVYTTLDWPDNVHIFSSGEIARLDLPQLGCAVHGRAFLSSQEAQAPLAGFHAPQDGLIHLMCLHGDVSPTSQYAPIDPRDIASSGLAYLALGHIHQYSGMQQAGDTTWAYPGCPQGRGFDELGEKGVLRLRLDGNRVEGELLPLGQRRYEILSVDVTGANRPLDAVLSALPQDTGRDIYRILLTGEAQELDLAALEAALAPRFFALQLRNQTRLPQNLWARREEDTLTGLFLQAMWEQCQQRPDDPVYQLAARYGLAALENGEDVSL